MKTCVAWIFVLFVMVIPAFSGSFRGEVTGPNGTKVYGNPAKRIANINTLAFLEQGACMEACRMMISPFPGDKHGMVSFLQRLAKNKQVFRVEIDTKVDVEKDLGYAFKGKIKGSEKDFWFISDHFFIDE